MSLNSHLAKLLTEVDELGERVVITRSGRPVGVLLVMDEYEDLLETLEILADPELSEAVRVGLQEVDEGDLVSREEVWGNLEASVHPYGGSAFPGRMKTKRGHVAPSTTPSATPSASFALSLR